MYKLTVTKIEPFTKEELEERDRYYRGYVGQTPLQQSRETRCVEVELTDAEYDVVRATLVEFWDTLKAPST